MFEATRHRLFFNLFVCFFFFEIALQGSHSVGNGMGSASSGQLRRASVAFCKPWISLLTIGLKSARRCLKYHYQCNYNFLRSSSIQTLGARLRTTQRGRCGLGTLGSLTPPSSAVNVQAACQSLGSRIKGVHMKQSPSGCLLALALAAPTSLVP